MLPERLVGLTPHTLIARPAGADTGADQVPRFIDVANCVSSWGY